MKDILLFPWVYHFVAYHLARIHLFKLSEAVLDIRNADFSVVINIANFFSWVFPTIALNCVSINDENESCWPEL